MRRSRGIAGARREAQACSHGPARLEDPIMDDDTSLSAERTMRIDLTRDTDVAYWCRLLDVDHGELRRAVQKVGPRADAVVRCIDARRAPGPEYDCGF